MGDPDLWVVSREGPADLTGRVGAAGLSRLMTALLILSLRISYLLSWSDWKEGAGEAGCGVGQEYGTGEGPGWSEGIV